MDSHYDNSPLAPKNLATALMISKFLCSSKLSKTKYLSKSAFILPIITWNLMGLIDVLHVILG
jgi:hypothetical protein